MINAKPESAMTANKSEIKPSDDVLKGSVQYIEVPFKFSALDGSSVSV